MEAIITEEIHREKCLNDLLIKWMTQKSASAFYSQNYKMKLEENALYGWRRRHWKQLVVEREIQIGGDWLTNLPNARKSFNENWNRRSDPASPAIDPTPKESSFWFVGGGSFVLLFLGLSDCLLDLNRFWWYRWIFWPPIRSRLTLIIDFIENCTSIVVDRDKPCSWHGDFPFSCSMFDVS